MHTLTRKHRHTHAPTRVHTHRHVHTHAPDFTGILGNRLLWPPGAHGEGLQLPGWAPHNGRAPTGRRPGGLSAAHRPRPGSGARAPCAGYWRTQMLPRLDKSPMAPLSPTAPPATQSLLLLQAQAGSVQGLPAGRRGVPAPGERSPPARRKASLH